MAHLKIPVIKKILATASLASKKKGLLIFILLGLTTAVFNKSYGQWDTLKVVPQPQVIQQNAGFDVIIKINGEIVYGLVKEVGIDVITYKRTDIPDGPIYTMLRAEVHAISYRNQVKEYFSPPIGEIIPEPISTNKYPTIDYKKSPLVKQGMLRLSFGVLKSITKLDNSKTYAASGTFPSVNIGYDAYFKDNVRLGLQIGFGSRKFSKQDFSSYDSLNNYITVKEKLISFTVYSKYSLMQSSSRLQPYIIGGVSINSSRINSETVVNFTNNASQSLIVKSGTRSTSLGILLRGGADYYINDRLLGFLDAGTGLSVFNLGVAINLK